MEVIFFRERYFAGTDFAIKSAKKYSPNSRIILIGDLEQNKDLCEFYPIDDFCVTREKLKLIYKHKAELDQQFVFSTLSMFAVLFDFCKKSNLKKIYFPDTDILTFCNIDEELKKFKEYDYTKSCVEGDSTQCPLLLNIEVLEAFIKFLFDIYKNSNDPIFQYDLCAMELWRQFRHRNPQYKCGNTAQIINGSTWDHNLVADYGQYERDENGKKIKFINGLPYCFNYKLNMDIRFNILHCWGYFKDKVESLYYKAVESERK